MRTILDLCSGTGAWSQPYLDAGYRVLRVDVAQQEDVRLLHALPERVWGVLAAPPCTHFAAAGARWWEDKGMEPVLADLAIVTACCRLILVHDPVWWALENPVGRLGKWMGPPVMTFNPSDFGDPWTKRTCLWGRFRLPEPRPVPPTEGSKTHTYPDSLGRAPRRAVTPPGFAQAFFEANP